MEIRVDGTTSNCSKHQDRIWCAGRILILILRCVDGVCVFVFRECSGVCWQFLQRCLWFSLFWLCPDRTPQFAVEVSAHRFALFFFIPICFNFGERLEEVSECCCVCLVLDTETRVGADARVWWCVWQAWRRHISLVLRPKPRLQNAPRTETLLMIAMFAHFSSQ